MTTNDNGIVSVDRDRLIEMIGDLTGDAEETIEVLARLGVDLVEHELSFTVTVTYRSLEPLTLNGYALEDAINEVLECEWDDMDLAPFDDAEVSITGDGLVPGAGRMTGEHRVGRASVRRSTPKPAFRKPAVRKAAVRKSE